MEWIDYQSVEKISCGSILVKAGENSNFIALERNGKLEKADLDGFDDVIQSSNENGFNISMFEAKCKEFFDKEVKEKMVELQNSYSSIVETKVKDINMGDITLFISQVLELNDKVEPQGDRVGFSSIKDKTESLTDFLDNLELIIKQQDTSLMIKSYIKNNHL